MPSFGEELKRERELRQITLREIAEATKINIRYLDALERNDFTHLPGGVFNKGFVRAYSQFIGIDPEAMVNAYLLEERGQDGTQERAPAPVERARPVEVLRPRSTIKRVLSLVLLLIVVGVLAGMLVLWYRRERQEDPAPLRPASNGLARPPQGGSEGRG